MIAAAPVVNETKVLDCVPLPPSGRDFDVYRRTAVEGRTTREVAAEFNISQTRVMQLRIKVFEWIGTHVPPLARLEPAERLRVAETLACEQLQVQYEEAMEAWRKSASAERSTRFVGDASGDGVTIVKESQGNPKYLRLATQISKAISKLRMATMPDPETAIPLASLQSAETDANHPLGDCSETTTAQVNAPASAIEVDCSKQTSPTICEVRETRNSSSPSTNALEFGTVQDVLAELENVPRKERKSRERQQQRRRELLGNLVAGG